jgi:hypothetical protein
MAYLGIMYFLREFFSHLFYPFTNTVAVHMRNLEPGDNNPDHRNGSPREITDADPFSMGSEFRKNHADIIINIKGTQILNCGDRDFFCRGKPLPVYSLHPFITSPLDQVFTAGVLASAEKV